MTWHTRRDRLVRRERREYCLFIESGRGDLIGHSVIVILGEEPSRLLLRSLALGSRNFLSLCISYFNQTRSVFSSFLLLVFPYLHFNIYHSLCMIQYI